MTTVNVDVAAMVVAWGFCKDWQSSYQGLVREESGGCNNRRGVLCERRMQVRETSVRLASGVCSEKE